MTIVTGIETNAVSAIRQSARNRSNTNPVRSTPCQMASTPPFTVAATYAPSSRTQSSRMPPGSPSTSIL